MTRHLIESIRFEPGTDDGPCVCSRGWKGRASEQPFHAGRGRRASDTCTHGHAGPWTVNSRGTRVCVTCQREAARRQRDRSAAR